MSFKICTITFFSFVATKPPGSLQFDRTKHKEGIPLTPTGYTQPPTPDFPPPSPHTAILGIEERMAIIDVSNNVEYVYLKDVKMTFYIFLFQVLKTCSFFLLHTFKKIEFYANYTIEINPIAI